MKFQKKVALVGFLPGFGGAEKSLIRLANGLAKLGHSVTILSLKDDNVVYDMEKQIDYIFIPDHGNSKVKRQLNRFLDLKDKLIDINPDIVISFWLQPAIFASIMSKFIGFKTIYSERGDPSDKEYSGILGLLRNIFLKLIDGFVFQTEGAKRYFSKSIQKRSIVINNPVSIKYDDYELPEQRRKIIINVGRLHEQKNQQLLINAFAKISDYYPDFTLEIYGDGELKEQLEILINDVGLQGKVFLRGTTNRLFDNIINASLFVLSSDYEGMPNALMEAMALGIPCISTDCKPGGARELITHKKNGLIIPRNSVDELAQSMKYILENPINGEIMGSAAKEICKTHSEEMNSKMWEKYILKQIKY